MNKKRKPLNDALAQSFVYGQSKFKMEEVENDATNKENNDQSETTELILENKSSIKKEKATNEQPNKELNMIDKLQIKPKEATKRFTVDLPESQHRKLSILAAKTGRTKADIVRMLLEEALDDIQD